MILVNNGMPKSGSTLLMFYMTELLQKGLPANGYEALWNSIASKELQGIAGFLQKLDEHSLPILERIRDESGPLAVKIHSDVTKFLMEALRAERIIMISTFRDPRDMLLSAMDHAARTKDTRRPAFQDCTSVETSIPQAKWAASMACRWLDSGLVHRFRYEDLITDPGAVIKQLAEIAGINCSIAMIEEILSTEVSKRSFGNNQFNTGRISRFRNEMTADEIALCNERLGDLITRLGYELD